MCMHQLLCSNHTIVRGIRRWYVVLHCYAYWDIEYCTIDGTASERIPPATLLWLQSAGTLFLRQSARPTCRLIEADALFLRIVYYSPQKLCLNNHTRDAWFFFVMHREDWLLFFTPTSYHGQACTLQYDVTCTHIYMRVCVCVCMCVCV